MSLNSLSGFYWWQLKKYINEIGNSFCTTVSVCKFNSNTFRKRSAANDTVRKVIVFPLAFYICILNGCCDNRYRLRNTAQWNTRIACMRKNQYGRQKTKIPNSVFAKIRVRSGCNITLIVVVLHVINVKTNFGLNDSLDSGQRYRCFSSVTDSVFIFYFYFWRHSYSFWSAKAKNR